MGMSYFKKWNTLRNQILFVYLVVMLIVLIIVGVLTFQQVSVMLRDNAEEQIQQTAIEASGRFDSLFEQLNLTTKQVASNTTIQESLMNEQRGGETSFNDKQELIRITNRLQANADGIYTIELYNKEYEKIIPLSDGILKEQIDADWINKADIEKGRLVWIGEDPQNHNYFAMIRRVNLMDHYFEKGGYLLIRINKNYLKLNDRTSTQENYMILTDEQNQVITSNYGDENTDKLLEASEKTIEIDDQSYMVVEQKSSLTNWTVTMLTPVSTLTKGINVLRTGVLISGLFGFIIFSIASYFYKANNKINTNNANSK